MLRRIPSRRLVLFILVLINCVLLSIYFFHNESSPYVSPPEHILRHPYFFYDLVRQEPKDIRQKCHLPRIHPFDSSVWPYFQPPNNITCRGSQPQLTSIDEEGKLVFNEAALVKAGYELGSLKCYWQPLLRSEDDVNIDYGDRVSFDENGAILPENVEIIRVQCRNKFSFAVYEMIHARIKDPKDKSSSARDLQNHVNVLIFGIDSISRLAFIRLLPKTYKYLTEILNMTVFRGMVKVGDNSYPNLIALLTGEKAYGGRLPKEYSSFDDHPLIWRNYSNAGYGTLWAEDFPNFGMFNYLDKGFKDPPTDHYFRPFWLAVEQTYRINFVTHLCYQNKVKHNLQMDYTQSFIKKYQLSRKPHFGFTFLAEESHDYISPVSGADSDFEDFFRFLKENEYLRNTVLIVMSDHGHRFDHIRSTRVGYIEERMPFYSIYIPKNIEKQHPSLKKVLKVNSGRLVTPFDVHETLVDLYNFVTIARPLGETNHEAGRLGQSLFRKVPANRTCKDASIPDHFCTCSKETDLPLTDPKAQTAVNAIVDHINGLLGQELTAPCAKLTLGRAIYAHLIHSDDRTENEIQKVRVTVELEPSKGIFEATVQMGDNVAGVLGDVSRINPYAGQNENCIKHVILRKYCYCKKTL